MQTAEAVEEILVKVKKEGVFFFFFFWILRAISKVVNSGSNRHRWFSRCKLPTSRKISKIVK